MKTFININFLFVIIIFFITNCGTPLDPRTWIEIKTTSVYKKTNDSSEIKLENPIEVMIITSKSYWTFIYAGEDKKLGTDDDVKSVGVLRVPVDRNIIWHLITEDVEHSFCIKNLRLNQVALPNRVVDGWFKIDSKLVGKVDYDKNIPLDLTKPEKAVKLVKENLEERVYEISCGTFCGSSSSDVKVKALNKKIGADQFGGTHHNLVAFLILEKQKQFDKWLESLPKAE